MSDDSSYESNKEEEEEALAGHGNTNQQLFLTSLQINTLT